MTPGQMDFYNSISLTGDALRKAREGAQDQQSIVLAWFQAQPSIEATPCEVHAAVLPRAPLTSVRRAITNLTKAGLLVRTDTQRPGQYGAPNYCWRLA